MGDITSLMTALALVFGGVLDMVGDVTTTMTSNPLLLLSCVGVPLCGIGIGFTKRLLRVRA